MGQPVACGGPSARATFFMRLRAPRAHPGQTTNDDCLLHGSSDASTTQEAPAGPWLVFSVWWASGRAALALAPLKKLRRRAPRFAEALLDALRIQGLFHGSLVSRTNLRGLENFELL